MMMSRRQPVRAAFTLVETVIAVAVVATVLLGLVALLPAGLGQYKLAADDEAEARIAAGITGRLQMMEWSALDALLAGDGVEYQFDQKGSPASDDEAVYAALARHAANASPAPGDSGEQPWLRRVEIVISARPDAKDRFENKPLTTSRVVTITKMDR